jgi:glycosyltransferase involved in cell wall biosynthesis
MSPFSARIGFQQRVFPLYRAPFFRMMAGECPRGFELFAGLPRPDESIEFCNEVNGLNLVQANNYHIFRGKFYLCWQKNLMQWLENWNPEVLILEANMRYLGQSAAVKWMKARKRPVIGWGLGSQGAIGEQGGMRTEIRKRFINQFQAMVTYSAQGAEQFRGLGFPKDKIFIAHNAVTPRPAYPMPERPKGYTEGRAAVLFVGRLQARKQVDLLIQACALLPEQHKPELWIVGDGPEKESLVSLAGEIYPMAKFYGALFGEALTPIFGAADLFVLPGTGGLAVQQAMSYGLPVMVAEADGTQVDLVRQENGWQIPGGRVSDLTKLLLDALTDPDRLRRMGRESYRIIQNEINIESMVSVFQEAVHSVWED